MDWKANNIIAIKTK